MRTARGRRGAAERRGYEILHRLGDPAERAAALDRVLLEVNEAVGVGLSAEIGPLSIALRRDEEEFAWGGVQLGSMPLAGFGGAEFRFLLPGCGPGAVYLADNLVEDLAEAQWRFLGARGALAARLDYVRGRVSRAIDRRGPDGRSATLVSIGYRAGCGLLDGCVVLDLKVLGHGLARGLVRVEVADDGSPEEALDGVLEDHARRVALLDGLHRRGLRGGIEGTALRIMALAGISPEVALLHLESHRLLEFFFDGRRQTCWMEWREGVLRADFQDVESGATLSAGGFNYPVVLPETVLSGCVGRELGQLLTHPNLPPEAVILEAAQAGRLLRLQLDIPVAPLPR